MKKDKVPGPSELQMEVVKIQAPDGEEWMLDLLRVIWEEEIMPKDWEGRLMVSKFEQKGNIMECSDYRGIKLKEHGLKLLEKVLDERLRKIAKIGKQQYEFMRGGRTLNAIFIVIVRKFREKRLEGNQKLFCAFVDLAKAYDRIPREVMF
ncbi:uncharacterized protein [Palaemon carinicauda]|uniref:uncharacterized protein n=1 Tax=Palaemon carinicauda TaxID=392227 RepID=UPI0035B5F8BF